MWAGVSCLRADVVCGVCSARALISDDDSGVFREKRKKRRLKKRVA